jgi:hypothetical protein
LLLNTTLWDGFVEEERYLSDWSKALATSIGGISSSRITCAKFDKSPAVVWLTVRFYARNESQSDELTSLSMIKTLDLLIANNTLIFGSDVFGLQMGTPSVFIDETPVEESDSWVDIILRFTYILGGLAVTLLLVLFAECCCKPKGTVNVD